MKAEDFLVPPATGVRLDERDPSSRGYFATDEEAEAHTQLQAERLKRLQEMLQAHEAYGVLILFQGMDSSGKDESIREVLSFFDPGISVAKQFKKPTETERQHDFLWRAAQALPGRGEVGIFNRSYYEQVTGERVYPEQVEQWGLPPEARENLWENRYAQINDFERKLVENGFLVVKFLLHVSKETARARLLERIEEPEMNWQVSEADGRHFGDWDAFHETFELMLERTSTSRAPWYLIPADERWGTYAAVATILVERLAALHTAFPEPDDEERVVLEKVRAALEGDGG